MKLYYCVLQLLIAMWHRWAYNRRWTHSPARAVAGERLALSWNRPAAAAKPLLSRLAGDVRSPTLFSLDRRDSHRCLRLLFCSPSVRAYIHTRDHVTQKCRPRIYLSERGFKVKVSVFLSLFRRPRVYMSLLHTLYRLSFTYTHVLRRPPW